MKFLFAMEEFGCSDFDCVIEGDDCLAIYKGVCIPNMFYTRLGFTIKLEYFRTCNYASFCGQIFDFESLIVIADPIKIIMNIGWSDGRYSNASEKKLKGLLRSKGFSLVYGYPGAPIIQSLGLCLLRLTEGISCVLDTSMSNYEKALYRVIIRCDIASVVREVPMSSREMMADVFGFSVLEQITLETYFMTLSKIEPLWHPIIEERIKPDWRRYNEVYVMGGGGKCERWRFSMPGACTNLEAIRCLKEKVNVVGKQEDVDGEKAVRINLRKRRNSPHPKRNDLEGLPQ